MYAVLGMTRCPKNLIYLLRVVQQFVTPKTTHGGRIVAVSNLINTTTPPDLQAVDEVTHVFNVLQKRRLFFC